MGHTSKTPKGEISITNSRGRIRLRWRCEGERFSLNLPYAFQSSNFHHANIKVAEIKLDMMKGCFDTTLQKYNQAAAHKQQKDKKEPVFNPVPVLKTIDQLAERFHFVGKEYTQC